MRNLITRALDAIDALLRRAWLAWRYVRALGDRPAIAWQKARRN